MNFKSDFLREFSERGFLAQITHSQELDEILSYDKISAYIGFDCTAKSLHAGSLIQIMILRLLQKHGHKPIVLLGGGTTKIGDPSGKDETRQVLSENQIGENLAGIKKTLEKFISFGGGASDAIMVNNDDWLKSLNYLDFLRDVGRHFSINRMLTFDSVKTRLERQQPLSFLEFNYMILQAYDFYMLNQKYACRLQIGGSDQWGNIVSGAELTRIMGRLSSGHKRNDWSNGAFSDSLWNEKFHYDDPVDNIAVFGLTSPLLTTADGKKMGKTADGAVWLDAEMLSPFDYFQYFRNVDDRDVGKFLRLFTDLEIPEIKNLEKLKDQETNQAKERLAFETTKICHGKKIAEEVLQKAREIFISKNAAAFEEKEIFFGEEKNKKLIDIIFEIGAAESKTAAKKLIEGKAVKINGEVVLDIQHTITKIENFDLSIGKKKFFKIIIKN